MEKTMKARIQHKHDTEANWNKALNFIPKIGEIIIYDIDENYNYSRFKIGDGVRTISNIEFSETDLTGYATESYVNEGLATKQPIGDYALKSEIPEFTPAIIDVVELPTENIREDVFYRLLSGVALDGTMQLNGWTVYVVEMLPSEGEMAWDGTNGIVYYQISDNTAYGYVTPELSSVMGVPAGWYPGSVLVPAVGYNYGGIVYEIDDTLKKSTVYLLLSYIVYSYKKSWNKQESIGRKGVGINAETFNDIYNTASGIYSHAEGHLSHAEGPYSHAEGYKSTASGEVSHAEGSFITASGVASHAEGEYTIASGIASHAEGSFTTASGDYQHVQGKYNVDDPDSKYAHIVGNGDGQDNCSNAHTLGWDGNAWFAGGLKVGGTGQDDPNAKEVALKEDIAQIVKYIPQTLTEPQKEQARVNIGAVSMEEVEELLGIKEEFSVSGEVVEFNVDVEEGTELRVISKIRRDSTWRDSNKLVLHQVSGTNFVDLTSYLGGAGTVFEKNGLTATINVDDTLTVTGTNTSADWTKIPDYTAWNSETSLRVYPAGTYVIPTGLAVVICKAECTDSYGSTDPITGLSGNLTGKIVVPEPFRVIGLYHSVAGNKTEDVTIPLGIFRSDSIPEVGYEYTGNIYTATFDNNIYEGEYNWTTGELKDINGNTVAYYEPQSIKRLAGINYFWTGFGENIVSNTENNLGKVVLLLNETAPEDTIPSICDFMFIPTTPEAAYGLYYEPFLPGRKFHGNEVPVMTTKGTLSVKDADDNIKYSKYIEPMFNSRNVADVLTHKGLEKKWSKKFYLNKEPASITNSPPPYSGPPEAYVFVWEFDESEFVNTGIPAKIHDIPMASPCFINNANSENNVNTQVLWNGDPYPAFFSYNAETGKYTLTARGIQGGSINNQLTDYSKVHFYYQLETPYNLPFSFAMGIDAGDTISFEVDLTDNQPYIDDIPEFKDRSVTPLITAFVPRNVEDAMDGMNNAALLLNAAGTAGGDATVQGYSWIGEGDGVTDYTTQIQSKLDELHTISNGGTIHLGPGTYPISGSLIVYANTCIIGDVHTIIEQRTDNTHAVIWNGSNIRMCDLTIKLAGACTELTACIFVNSNNIGEHRNEKYPENAYVQFCSTSNVTLTGTYEFSFEDGYAYLSDRAMAYRGVGILQEKLFFNYYDCDGLICKHLYAGVHGGGGANNYRMFVTESRFAFYGGGGNNTYDIQGHSYYDRGRDGRFITGTEYVFYGVAATTNTITIGYYDTQHLKGLVYFDGGCKGNRYSGAVANTELGTGASTYWDSGYTIATDYGRGNGAIQPYPEKFTGVGSHLPGISGLPTWNTQFNPSVHNALSGAGVWGIITSNKEWTSNGIGLSDVCRYPKDTFKNGTTLASAICEASPSEESPIEIIIDISDRPVINCDGFWIQFDHRYVAEEYTVSFDTTNDGTFNYEAGRIIGNSDTVSHYLNFQSLSTIVYRIKISITKALQIQGFKYLSENDIEYTIDYNSDGFIGIVNIGMPSNEAYGRAFLGECGGNMYGNVDMHQNTLKNLPSPVDDGDAVSKAYVDALTQVLTDEEIDELLALIQ